jgi:hypothetical protein
MQFRLKSKNLFLNILPQELNITFTSLRIEGVENVEI